MKNSKPRRLSPRSSTIRTDGTPRRVMVRRNEIEFDYGLRRFVRIEFDQDGAQVISR